MAYFEANGKDLEDKVRTLYPYAAARLPFMIILAYIPTVFWSIVPIAFVAGVASFAAVQEGHFIRTGRVD